MKRNYSLAEFGVTKHEKILANGLRVIFLEKPYAPIYAKLEVGAGSIFNPCDNGLAHFAEHVIVGASSKYPKKELMASIINTVGGYSNAFTSLRYMSFECEIAIPEHLKNMKEYFSASLGDVYLTPALLEKEKGIISSEIKKATSDPYYHTGRFMRNAIAGNSSWVHSNLGTIESINAITSEDITTFFEKYCVVENMILIICGGCSPEEVEETFGNIPFRSQGAKAILPPDPLPLLPHQRIFYEQDIDETNVSILFKAPEINTRESVLISFAIKHAHAGLDSPFFSKIRNEKGLAYDVSPHSIDFQRLRYGGTSTGIPAEKLDETIDVILDCYEAFIKSGMSQFEIEQRIKRIFFSDKRTLQRSINWVKTFDEYLFEDEIPIVGDYPDIYNFYESITSEEITAVLQKYITLDNFHLLINGREASKKYF